MEILKKIRLKFRQKFILIIASFIFSWLLSSPMLLKTVSIDIHAIVLYSIIRFIVISLILVVLIYFTNKNIIDELIKNREDNEKLNKQQNKLLYALRNDYFFYRHLPDNYFEYINNALQNILGYTKDEFIQYLKLNKIDVFTEQVFEKAELYSKEGILIPSFEVELTNRNGEKRLFEVSQTPMFDKNNKIIAIEGIVHNLSDNYRNVTENISFEEKYNMLYENSNDAILLINNNKFIDCNKKSLEVFGATYEKIIMDSPFSINFSPFKQPNGEISRELALEKIQQVKRVGKINFLWTHLKNGTDTFNASITLVYKKIENEEIIFAFVKDLNDTNKNNSIENATKNVLAEIFDNSRALLYKLNIETGKYEYLSKSIEDITGYTKEEIFEFSEEDLKSLLHPNDLENADNIIAKLVSDNNSKNSHFSVMYRFKSKSGEYRWFSDSYRIIKNEVSSYIIGNVHDITEMMEYRNALKINELRFRKTVDNIQNGVSIFENDKIVYVNDRLVEITGYSRKELLNLNSLKDLAIKKEEARLSEISEQDNINSLEFWINKKNGQHICILNRYSESHINENLYGKYVITADITEQKKLELALIEKEEKFRNLTNNLSQAIFEVNKDGVFSFINQSGLNKIGFSSDEIIDKIRLIDLSIKEGQSTLEHNFNKILNGKIIEHLDLKIKTKKGNVIPFRIYPSVINEKENNIGIRGLMIDISDETQAKEEIRIAKKTVNSIQNPKNNLIAEILHEMVNPVNSISGMINLIESTKLSEKQYDFLKVISKSSESLSELIQEIKGITNTSDNKSDIDFLFLINEIKTELSNKFKNTDINFKLKQDFSENFLIIDDKEKIKRIINNVVSLSKSIIEKGTIEFEVKIQEKKTDTLNITFFIKNDSKRLLDEEIDKVNELIKNPTKKIENCIITDLLKLNITIDLINEFNGELNFLKGEQGRNIFSFNLILESKEKNINNLEDNTQKLNNIRILLAEDQLFNQMVIKTMARNWDCVIDIVEDGEQVIEQLKKHTYDLILMDIHMPIMNGVETLKHMKLKCKEKNAKIPVIAITGDIYKNIDDFKDYNVNSLIIKPFTSQELFISIVKALGIYTANIQETDEPVIKNNGIYSLEIIDKLSKGNEDIKIKMIRVFIKKTQEELKELKATAKQKNWDKVFAISHKMKPAFGYLKIDQAEEYLLEIVENSKDKTSIKNIPKKIELLETEIERVISVLKQDFEGNL